MYDTDGIGLAAPQVAANVRVMVYNPVGERGRGEEWVLVNPSVVSVGSLAGAFEEGCLSFPGVNGDVTRPEDIAVRAQDLQGELFEMELSGLPARIFQHEFDHLEGVLFPDRFSAEDLALPRNRHALDGLEEEVEDGCMACPAPLPAASLATP